MDRNNVNKRKEYRLLNNTIPGNNSLLAGKPVFQSIPHKTLIHKILSLFNVLSIYVRRSKKKKPKTCFPSQPASVFEAAYIYFLLSKNDLKKFKKAENPWKKKLQCPSVVLHCLALRCLALCCVALRCDVLSCIAYKRLSWCKHNNILYIKTIFYGPNIYIYYQQYYTVNVIKTLYVQSLLFILNSYWWTLKAPQTGKFKCRLSWKIKN